MRKSLSMGIPLPSANAIEASMVPARSTPALWCYQCNWEPTDKAIFVAAQTVCDLM
jgi:hypothetical protein